MIVSLLSALVFLLVPISHSAHATTPAPPSHGVRLVPDDCVEPACV
jgi:hypothetical protein